MERHHQKMKKQSLSQKVNVIIVVRIRIFLTLIMLLITNIVKRCLSIRKLRIILILNTSLFKINEKKRSITLSEYKLCQIQCNKILNLERFQVIVFVKYRVIKSFALAIHTNFILVEFSIINQILQMTNKVLNATNI